MLKMPKAYTPSSKVTSPDNQLFESPKEYALTYEEYLRLKGTEFVAINAGNVTAGTTITLYTVPAGYTLFIDSLTLTAANTVANGFVEVYIRTGGTIYVGYLMGLIASTEIAGVNNNKSFENTVYSHPIRIPENSVLNIYGQGGTTTTSITGIMRGFLVANSYLAK